MVKLLMSLDIIRTIIKITTTKILRRGVGGGGGGINGGTIFSSFSKFRPQRFLKNIELTFIDKTDPSDPSRY